MKKLMLTMFILLNIGSAWAAPNLELESFRQKAPILATITIAKGTNSFYKMDFYFTISDNEHEFTSHSETSGAYHPFFKDAYIVNHPTAASLGNIVKAEAQLVIKSCSSKEFNDCAVVKKEYLNLDIVDNQIVGINPNRIDVTL